MPVFLGYRHGQNKQEKPGLQKTSAEIWEFESKVEERGGKRQNPKYFTVPFPNTCSAKLLQAAIGDYSEAVGQSTLWDLGFTVVRGKWMKHSWCWQLHSLQHRPWIPGQYLLSSTLAYVWDNMSPRRRWDTRSTWTIQASTSLSNSQNHYPHAQDHWWCSNYRDPQVWFRLTLMNVCMSHGRA